MEEVWAVLHVIFGHLLKRLDSRELRDAAGIRQGKTCHLFHKSNFADAKKSRLLVLWIVGDRSTGVDTFSTVPPELASPYPIVNILIFPSIHDLGPTVLRFLLSARWQRDKTFRSWMDFNP